MRAEMTVIVSDNWTPEVIRVAAESQGCSASDVREHWPDYAREPMLMVTVSGSSVDKVRAAVALLPGLDERVVGRGLEWRYGK